MSADVLGDQSGFDVTIGVRDLADRLAGPRPPVVLDVRWELADADGDAERRYLSGHLPGAVFVDLVSELSADPSPAEGRHPLPPISRLQVAARRWGINHDSTVVVYDSSGGLSAARAWWLLRWGGLEDVLLLDGGLPAWLAVGGELQNDPVHPQPGSVVLRPDNMTVLDADQAEEIARTGVLIDARAAERFRGEQEPIDPQAGHIPGAISWPATEALQDSTLRPAAEVRAQLTAVVGDRPIAAGTVGAYCGSGVVASFTVLVLARLGIDAGLYAGSWSQWSADEGRAVAVG